MSGLLSCGGPAAWLIVALGVATALLFLLRLVELRRAHVDWEDFVQGVANLLAKGNADEALAVCDDTPSPVARVVAVAVVRRAEGAAAIRDAVETASRSEVRRHSRRLNVFPLVAQVAPLLGLFGTVLGFADLLVTLKSDAPLARADLVGGLAPALVAAAAGLLVAILAHVAHALLRSRLDRIVAELDASAAAVRSALTAAEGKAG